MNSTMGWSLEEKGATVLIADDDESQLILLEQTLLISHFKVIAVHDGVQAFDAFVKHLPDVVLLDVDMPQMDGFATCELIRRKFPELNVPIVIITGMDDIDSIEKAYAAGADDFISKPLSWPVLGHRVIYYLKSSQALREIKERNEKEKALFRALPDVVIHFDRHFQVKQIHKGKLDYLFTDLDPDKSNINECATIKLVQRILISFLKELDSIDGRTQFEQALPLNGKLNFIEIRIASCQHNELVVVLRDISERKEHEERIVNLVLYDQLTNLPNRHYLEDELERILNTDQTQSMPLALLFISIDKFSKLYESFGLKVGDELVKSISIRLKEALIHILKSDLTTISGHYRLSRFSENEFVVMLTGVADPDDVSWIGQSILDKVSGPCYVDDYEFPVSLSIGIAYAPQDSSNSVKLIEMAGQAVYLAQSSVSHMSFYSADFEQQAKRKLLIDKYLRKALERGELYVVYQPKHCISQVSMLSAEVLIRWVNDELGPVSPEEFIPIAEQDDMILEIGRWVVEQAVAMNAKLYHEHGLAVELAINLSPQQFVGQPNLVEFLTDTVEKAGMEPQYFEFEITENVLIEDVDFTLKQLDRLHKVGFSIAIDDFGTGYSSMNYLTRFNIDTLKIDKSFINGLDDPRNKKLIEILIAMGEKLDIKVVAEGVETEEQLVFLIKNKCDYVQGYVYSKPLILKDFVSFLHGIGRSARVMS